MEGVSQESEDSSMWIPLDQGQSEESNDRSQSSREINFVTPRARVNPSPAAPVSLSNPTSTSRLQEVKNRLEKNTKIREGLLDHPLDHGWALFATHLVSQIWDLDLRVRLGIVLVSLGLLFQLVVVALSFPCCHPRAVFLLLVFIASFVYLTPSDMERKIRAFINLVSSPTLLLDITENLDERHFRYLLFGFLLFPTLLEMRTLAYLSEIIVECGWTHNILTTVLVFVITTYRRKHHKATPKDEFNTATLVLYGLALLGSLCHLRPMKIPFLAAPFFLATGVLLLSHEEGEWLNRAVRQALRLTLRDILVRVGDNVHKDEMLQLAMIRWIVDYWSYKPTSPEDAGPGPSASSADTPTPTPANNPSGDNGASTLLLTSQAVATPTLTSKTSTFALVHRPRRHPQPHEELQWGDLLPMLNTTTDQMEVEAAAYHTPNTQTSTTPTSSSHSLDENPSMENLKTMLASMNVDESAGPAVAAYKKGVEQFPPSRTMALILSVGRRSPAGLVLCWRYLFGAWLALPSTLVLMPMIVTEIHRVLFWAESCNNSVQNAEGEQTNATATTTLSSPIPSPADIHRVLDKIDPMCILLSTDDYSPLQPPTLLQVWFNVKSSVAALEAGLTAARCAHTTAVAVDFASNMMSLAHLGAEVSRKGWMHGIAVLAQELIHMHSGDGQQGEVRYASAAIGAVRSGQIVARNVQKLMEEQHAQQLVEPVVGAAASLGGKGWLWGTEGPPSQEASSVEIIPLEGSSPAHERSQNSELQKNRSTEALSDSTTPIETEVRRVGDENRACPETEDTPAQKPEPGAQDQDSGKSEQVPASPEKQREPPVLTRSPTDGGGGLGVVEDAGDTDSEKEVGSQSWHATVQREILVLEGTMNPSAEAHPDPSPPENPSTRDQQRQQPSTGTTGGSIPRESRENNPDDWMKWVGGGLAVIGAAVVGGVALAHATHHDSERERRSQNRSTVVIEELGRENDDDWVAVSSHVQ